MRYQSFENKPASPRHDCAPVAFQVSFAERLRLQVELAPARVYTIASGRKKSPCKSS